MVDMLISLTPTTGLQRTEYPFQMTSTSPLSVADRLRAGLAGYGIRRAPLLARYDDHSTDAILTAAWMAQAAGRAELWHPAALTPAMAAVEGWTFGIP